MDLKPRHPRGFFTGCTSGGTEPAAPGSPFEPARRSARLTGTEELMQDLLVRHDHRERHRYRSRLRASQRGRHHRVPIGRVRDGMVHWLAAPAPPRTAWRRVTYRAEVARWPAARITLRQGARVLKNWTGNTVA